MLVQTKLFGEIELDENRELYFENGIIGFPDLKKFYIIRDEEKQDSVICWLQSSEDATMAIPVMNPLLAMEDYNPVVDDEMLKPLGELTEDNIMALVTVTVPADIEKLSVNLKAPIVINADTRRACQMILEDEKYLVRYPIYDMIKKAKEKDGE